MNHLIHLFRILICSITLFCNVYATTYFINPTTGNDTYTGLDTLHPFKTFAHSGSFMHDGDSLYILGNSHIGIKDEFRRWGTQSNWVYIRPFNRANVILNGSGMSFRSYDAVFSIQSSKFVDIMNIEVIGNNDSSSGIRVISDFYPTISQNIRIKTCKVHDVKRQGILIQARDVLVENCEIYNAVLRNAGGPPSSSWEFALGTYLWPDSLKVMTNVTFRNNTVHNCWGEGIVALRCYNFVIENNHVYDCFSAYIYVDNSRKGRISNNWVHSTNDTYNRNYGNGFIAPGIGIQWAAEGNSYKIDSLVSDIDIYNNLIVRTISPISWWRDTSNHYFNNSYKNINVFYNTIYNSIGYETFHLDTFATGVATPQNCNFKNNIVCLPKWGGVYRQYFSTSSHYQQWQIDYNSFIHKLIPVNVQHNIEGPPTFVDSTNPGLDSNLKIRSSSNCIDKGIPVNGINFDYWNLRRDTISPNIGFHEYGGLTGIQEHIESLPHKFAISQNYPNPFNPTTYFELDIPLNSKIKLSLYDISGRLVKILLDGYIQAGFHKIDFSGENFATGVYFCQFQAANFSDTKKIILLK